jgi:hypothetical protein
LGKRVFDIIPFLLSDILIFSIYRTVEECNGVVVMVSLFNHLPLFDVKYISEDLSTLDNLIADLVITLCALYYQNRAPISFISIFGFVSKMRDISGSFFNPAVDNYYSKKFTNVLRWVKFLLFMIYSFSVGILVV